MNESVQPTQDPAAERLMRLIFALRSNGVTDARVLAAMERVDRGAFVRGVFAARAYEDLPLPISCGQTISQPSVVGQMTQALNPQPRDKVLEVGTGSGYQAAILSRLVKEVYSVEIHKPLAEGAAKVLKKLGYDNVKSRAGDGYEGWPDAAPFDAVIVTCAPEKVPQPLVD